MRKGSQKVLVLSFEDMENKLYEMYVLVIYFSITSHLSDFKDIRGLLQEWQEELADCERVWIRASISNRRIFFDFDETPFAKGDERLRTFPFPTRRPVSFPPFSYMYLGLSLSVHRRSPNLLDVYLNSRAPKFLISQKKIFAPRMMSTWPQYPSPDLRQLYIQNLRSPDGPKFPRKKRFCERNGIAS